MIGVRFTRNEKRLKNLVIKWFDDNASLIEPLKANIIIDCAEQKGEKKLIVFNCNECDSDFQTDPFDFEC